VSSRSRTFRFASWLTRYRAGVYFFRYVWTPFDKLVLKLTGGRHGAAPKLIPELVLTTTGRRSGEPRSNPVLYLEEDGAFVVIGSNYGRKHHPAWTYNLTANPAATIRIGDREDAVRARRATPEEFESYWPRFIGVWAGWKTYRRMTDREFRMFVLEPTG